MILYYSATGNTEFVARELAKRLDDECVALLPRIKAHDYSDLHSNKPFVICAPVYVCEMPRFLAAYLKKQSFTGSNDVYFVFTSGGYAGISGQLAKWMFKSKGMNYKGHAEFKMPRNYIANDSYPMLEREEVEKRIVDSYKMIGTTADIIKNGGKLKSRHIFLFETIITVPFNPVWSKYKLTAKDFHATDGKCIGCGKCEKLCPLNNIKVTDKSPIWGNHCSHCMACIGNCTTRAIEYGNITQTKEQYNFEKFKYVTKNFCDNKNKGHDCRSDQVMQLERFVTAQECDYDIALSEIRKGRKCSHWIWYIFPQIQGLGYSSTAQYYAIQDRKEAVAYLKHPTLGPRLIEISEALLSLKETSVAKVMGYPDDLKLKSSMTLFYEIGGNEIFKKVLDKYFEGKLDEKTLEILKELEVKDS